MIKYTFAIICLGLPLACFGAQNVVLKEGTATKVNISVNGLNHIAVKDDRIISVKGTSNQFQLDKDEVLGQIYLQLDQNCNEPIHVFINTEKQHTLSVLLVPSDIPAESIMLTLDSERKTASTWEQSQPYEVVITDLIKAMHNQTPLEGYSVEVFSSKGKSSNGLEIMHLKSYRGQSLYGEVLHIRNHKKEAVDITETEFYKLGVCAVAILNKTLHPNEKTMVFLVKENG